MSPFWLAGAGLVLLALGYRAIRRRRILGSSGEMRDTREVGFYLRIGGFWLSGLILLVFGAMAFEREYGWSVLVIYLGLILLMLWFVLRAKAIRKGLTARAASILRPRKRRKQQREREGTAKAWALAAAALPGSMRGLDHQTLGGRSLSPANEKRARKYLRKEWDIDDEEELEEVQDWLMETGHRTEFFEEIERYRLFSDEFREGFLLRIDQGLEEASSDEEKEELKGRVSLAADKGRELSEVGFLAWDYLRFLDNCRAAFLAGYLEEEEAWDAMLSAAQVLQSRYDSWEECGEAFLAAREYWSVVETEKNGMAWRKMFLSLRENPKSPWNQVPWDLSLFQRS